MYNFKEYFLQHIWRYQLFDKNGLKTTSGEPVLIIKQGLLNKNQGPDFLNAHINIASIDWHGAVEVHVSSADWLKHKHQNDANYEGVVLHVVWNNNAEFSDVPTLVLKGLVSEKYISNFDALVKSEDEISCRFFFQQVNSIYKTEMLERSFFARMERKTDAILDTLVLSKGDWQQTIYALILKYFGFLTNKDSFEELAQKLPLKILLKHRANLIQIEAMLFGVSGLLSNVNICDDEYLVQLNNEYQYFKKLYDLNEISIPVKFLRLRPANFPTIRLSQFADLIHNHSDFFNHIFERSSYKNLLRVFTFHQSDYWLGNYTFGKLSSKPIPSLGDSSKDLLIINVIVPLMLAYGKQIGQESTMEQWCFDILNQIKPEKNSKIEVWEIVDFKATNAYDSQALLEWHNEYCVKKRCLECSVGLQILKK
jgi:hypothetical protein